MKMSTNLSENNVFKQKISEMIEASRNLIESKASVMIKQINALKEENEKIINKCIFIINVYSYYILRK